MRNGCSEKGTDSEKEKLHNAFWVQDQPGHAQFSVLRRVYQQESLNKDANYHAPQKPVGRRLRRALGGCGLGECLARSVPLARWLPRYQRRDLLCDLVAGATTAVMHIPQGMAYALLAEVPPIVGLYMAFFPVLVYAVLGTSPHISMGTFAVACLMAGKVVTEHATHYEQIAKNNTDILEGDEQFRSEYDAIQVITVLTLLIGIIQIAMWLMRLGAVCALLSEPLVSGLTTAAALHVLGSQLKDLLGITLPAYNGYGKLIFTVVEIVKRLHTINWVAAGISLVACLLISLNNELLKPWVSKRSRVPVPIELIAVAGGAAAGALWPLRDSYGVREVGDIPTGLPTPHTPPIELMPSVALDAFTITMVTYTISMSMALIFASKEKYEVDANQELLALGASNVFGSFFCCGPMCASLSRSYVQYQAGARTPLTTLVSASLVLGVLLWVGPAFERLPRCVLAAVIVVSLKNMFLQVRELARFWKLSPLDGLVWLCTFGTTVAVDISIGLGVGVLASLGALFYRSQRPYTCLLGRVLDTDLYLDIKRYRAAKEVAGIKIFHYCGGLNFATKNLFRDALLRKVGLMRPTPVKDDLTLDKAGYQCNPATSCGVECVIVDASALSHVDAPGVRALAAARAHLDAAGVALLLAGANAPVLEMIERYNRVEAEPLRLDTFPTVHDAVAHFKMAAAQPQNGAVVVQT